MKLFQPNRYAAPSLGARSGNRKGMSLIEVILASTMFTGVGYVLSMGMRASDQSFDTVVNSSEANKDLRDLTAVFVDELKAAQRSTIEVTQQAGFSQLEFCTAIAGTGGNPAWGAYDREISIDESECSREGWSIRYGVDAPTQGTMTQGNASLVRSILDVDGTVQHSTTLAENVTHFSVTEAGDVWVVELTTQGKEGIRNEEFDVRTRDQ